MTQEILDYLWIRSLIISYEEEELIEIIDTEEKYVYCVNSIYTLMEQEDFILTSEALHNRVRSLLREYRFEYKLEKNTIEKINAILLKINSFRDDLSEKEKVLISSNWLVNETDKRGLPRKYRNFNVLFEMISRDQNTFLKLTSSGVKLEQLYDLLSILSLLNLIINKFPDICRINFEFDAIQNYLQMISEMKNNMPHSYKKILQTTINNIDELYDNKGINKVRTKELKKD